MIQGADTPRSTRGAKIYAVLAVGCAVGPFSWMGAQFVFGSAGSGWWRLPTNPGFILGMFAAGIADAIGFNSWSILNLAPFLSGPLLFYGLCFPLFRGQEAIPTRSWIALLWMTGLAVISAVGGAITGPQVQGFAYTARALLIEGSGLGVVWILYALARRKPSFVHNLFFHWAALSWLLWLAFPILGHFEGP